MKLLIISLNSIQHLQPETTATDNITQEPSLLLAQRALKEFSNKSGKTIKVSVNYFAMVLEKLERACHYDVAIEPDKPKKEMRRVVEEFRLRHFPNRYPAFDGVKNLYSSKNLPFEDQLQDDIVIQVDGRDKKYKVAVKLVAYVDLSSLRNYFSNRPINGDHLVTPQKAIQCLDVVLRSAPVLKCISVGRSFFTKPEKKQNPLTGGMEMYCGFYQSAILGWKPFLNIDVAHKAFATCQPVTSLIMELYNLGNVNQLENDESNYNWRKLEDYLKTLKIQYEIPKQLTSRKVYRVNGLVRSPREERFTMEGRPPMTVFEYFKNEKGYSLKYPTLPCLWVGNRDRQPRVLLPAELCTVIEGQDIKRKLNETQTSKMIRYAATDTNARKKNIMDAMQSVQHNSNAVVREFSLSLAHEFENVDARILPPPTLLYGHEKTIKPCRGAWKNNNKFIRGASLTKWTIGCLDDTVSPEDLSELARLVCTVFV